MLARKFLMMLLIVVTFCVPVAHAGPALVFEATKGTVVYAEDPDRPWHPASLTKLMTAYLVFEALRKGTITANDVVISSEVALQEPPSKLGLPVGTELDLPTALRALIVKSANDVAVMLAEKLAGDKAAFVELMNAKARALGMTRTVFANPNGLHDIRQVTTARDMAHLSQAIIHHFPEHAHLFTEYRMKLGGRVLRSYNSLLTRFAGADGMKTGFICASGYNVVASATRDGKRLVAVVFGALSGRDREKRAAKLLEHGFQMLSWKKALFSTDIDNMSAGTYADVEPQNMRPVVCKRPVRKVRRKKKRRRRKVSKAKN